MMVSSFRTLAAPDMSVPEQHARPRNPARRRWLAGGATAAASLAFPALAAGPRIVLGQSAAFSGPAAQLGIQMRQGAMLHFDQVNAAGGINGLNIELRQLDDGYEPDRCKANTEQFIKDDVLALFGYVGTPTTLAALPLVNAARVPLIGPFTGAEALRDPFSRYMFHIRASYYAETALIVNHLVQLGLRRIAVFHQADSYGQAGLDGVMRALTPLGLAPVALGTVARNTVEVKAAVAAIVPTGPNAVVQIGAYKACAAFIRQARAAGYGGLFYNVSFVGTQALADELGPQASGVSVSQVMPYPYSAKTAIAREYFEALRLFGSGAKPNYSSIEGFIAAKVMAEGLRRAGRNATRENLVDALETVQMAMGGFRVNLGPRDHTGSDFVELSLLMPDGTVRH
jgi:branched-chain amino acid transport system substrate-binding protein